MKLEVADIFRACIRRWYIFLSILAIAAWYANESYTSVTPVYYANAVVGVTSSNEQAQYNPNGLPVPRNGLLDIGGAQLILNMVVLGYDDPAVRTRVVSDGGQSNFTVRMFPNPPASPSQNTLPLIMIEATEPDAASATKTVELAAAQADSILAGIQQQAGVPDSQLVRAVTASKPKAVWGLPSRSKSSLVILMFGVGLAILGALASDVLINRLQRWWQRRNSGSTRSGTAAGAKPSPQSADFRREDVDKYAPTRMSVDKYPPPRGR